MIRLTCRACSAAMALVPLAASAHVAVGDAHGFVHGFSHPFSGLDHVLAMTSVGLLAARLGGRALWLVPLSFVAVMPVAGIAGIAGMVGLTLPFVDLGIALSVVVLGIALAWQVDLSVWLAASIVGLFAIFHGYAHGVEMPGSLSRLSYGAGFVCATALLHAMGIGLGIAAGRLGRVEARRLVQIGGAAIAMTGVALVISP